MKCDRGTSNFLLNTNHYNCIRNRLSKNMNGEYGVGAPNERGNRLIQFCEKDLVIVDTFFKLSSHRLYTWRTNTETPDRMV